MEQRSSSKVTVEYFDPFNLYSLINSGLLVRLPLTNLHWESHAGPLRSIKSLHVDLVPTNETAASTSTTYLSRVKSTESAGSADDGFRTQPLGKPADDQVGRDSQATTSGVLPKGQRHQIPGLRQTPYLKIFLLRCDDNETYKASAKKQVKEWIKAHTPPTQSSAKQKAQENHDAFEYLILHVIVPNTAAAMQPRTSTKGSGTILDKLKSDFNGTSKTSSDRVAQIRIGINDVPYNMLPRVVPVIPGSNPYTESPQEHDASWQDLMAKMKSLILDSFDMRVSQYEEDIREKDAQRALPGWNFCTFFVLKEGLARGFESVGLVEDSLVGYDELAVGLDAIIREQAVLGGGPAHGGSFLPYTEDLANHLTDSKKRIRAENGHNTEDTEEAVDLQTDSISTQEQDEILLSADRKPYRELILENKISIFEFKCYLFARQLALLLRMGNAVSSREELLAKLQEARETALLGVAARHPPVQQNEEGENLSILSDICRRSVDFLANICRIMRDDLMAAEAQSSKKGDAQALADQSITTQAIDNIISSFSFTISQQILAQTATRSLPIPPSSLAPLHTTADGDHEKATIPEPKTMMHPARSSSLISNPPVRSPSPNIFPGRRASTVRSEGSSGVGSTFMKTGLEDLAASRAQIYLLSRSVLERLGQQRDWLIEWKDVNAGNSTELEDVDLDPEGRKTPEQTQKLKPSSHGVDNKLLQTALQDKEDFHRLYEIITDKALRHFSVAGHVQSVQSTMADLALLRFHLQDYASAATYLYRINRFYGDAGWENIQMPLLVIYMKCLKELGRYDEYVKATMTLLSKSTSRKKAELERKASFKFGCSPVLVSEEDISVEGYLTQLMTVVPESQHDIALPLHSFFSSIEVEGGATYHDKRDSFSLRIKFRYLLPDRLRIEKGKVRLTNLKEGQGRDIWMDIEEPYNMDEGVQRVTFQSNVTIPGTYVLKQILLYSSKMAFGYDADTEPPQVAHTKSLVKCPQIALYQRSGSFDVQLSASRNLHLGRHKNLEVTIVSGWNDISGGEVNIRAATAGLRLQTAASEVTGGTLDISKKSEPGVIKFGALTNEASARVSIPFTLEHETTAVSLKVEVAYMVGEETFYFASNFSVSVMLALGVNVQDCFKQKTLFSKFAIAAATPSPLRLLGSSLSDSDVYEATNGGALDEPVVIYPRHAASLLYCTTRRSTPVVRETGKPLRSVLQLKLNYIPIEEELDDALDSVLSLALKNSELAEYNRLIVSTVLSVLRSRLTPHNLEQAAMLSELSTKELRTENWVARFNHRYPSTAMRDLNQKLADFVHKVLAGQSIIPLPAVGVDWESIARSRSIVIPVEVPTITVVHSVDLQLSPSSTSSIKCGDEEVAVLHQPLAATLVLKHTRLWESPTSAHRDKELAFTYEVSAPADTWLVGGRRKGGFVVPAAGKKIKTLRFPVMLVPLREGYFGFPNLDIRAVPVVRKEDDGKDEERITSEVEWKNAASVVRVSSVATKTTVSLGAPGPHGGAYLMESERVAA